MSREKVLVTGGAGFIGSHLVEELVAQGAEVVVLDNFSTGKRENLSRVAPSIRLIEGSVADPGQVEEAAQGVNCIFHLAAIPSVQQCIAQPIETAHVNFEGSVRVIEAAKRNQARIIFSSSSAVYGDSDEPSVQEDQRPKPLSPYAVQKLATEHMIRVNHSMFGLEGFCLRYFNVYGSRQDPQSEYAAVVPKFVTRALEGRDLVIFGDGEQTRDFVHVSDIVRANLLAMKAADADGAALNIGSGESLTVTALAKTVLQATSSDSKIDYQPERLGDIKHSTAIVDRARERIGFQSSVSLLAGLQNTIQYWQSRAA